MAAATALAGPRREPAEVTTKTSTRVGIYGSGRTATELVRALRPSPHRITAGIVHSERRAGADLGELTCGEPNGIPTTSDLAAAVGSGDFDLLLYAGLSGERHEEAMRLCVDAGIDLVHACFVHPRTALEPAVHDRLAARAAVTGSRVVGTGMIPGLWLDVLPALLSSGLPAPVSVRAARASDISSWGADVLRTELGVGTVRSGTADHVDGALRQSAQMIAEALGLVGVTPASRGGLVLADEDTTVGEIAVARGQVEGFRQEVVVACDGVERVVLAWSGLAGRPTASSEEKSVVLSLVGVDRTAIEVRIATPLDPYPGTAARMVQAVGGLAGLAPGLHPTSALPASS
ncbi:hypothetical protein GCM10009798_05220 [Nocardioides panacihumi]|uniref:Dihydrodipicolinate reductase n=1 Tax=Nocardioides panacihumi TaxID=400774 RepID=A0ABN2QBF9_9ACTN